jgi:hypothetical protein
MRVVERKKAVKIKGATEKGQSVSEGRELSIHTSRDLRSSQASRQ